LVFVDVSTRLMTTMGSFLNFMLYINALQNKISSYFVKGLSLQSAVLF